MLDPAISNPELPDNGTNLVQLDSVNGVLVLKPAIEPVNSQILATALQDARAERIGQLMSW